jgi:hypothetical protein
VSEMRAGFNYVLPRLLFRGLTSRISKIILGVFQCCGSGMFIQDPNFFHPGSRVKRIQDTGSGSASKKLSILNLKIVSKLSEI